MTRLEVAGKEIVAGDEIAATSIGYGHPAEHRLTVVEVTRIGAFVSIETDPGNHHIVPVNRTVTVWRAEPDADSCPELTGR